MSEYKVELLTVERFLAYWAGIEKQLDTVPHLWSWWWTKESLRLGVCEERFQCWAVGDATTVRGIIFSQVVIYPANMVFQAFLAFGDGLTQAVDEIEATFERFCAIRGVGVAEVTGRPGWESILRRKAFRRTGTILSKRLELGRLN